MMEEGMEPQEPTEPKVGKNLPAEEGFLRKRWRRIKKHLVKERGIYVGLIVGVIGCAVGIVYTWFLNKKPPALELQILSRTALIHQTTPTNNDVQFQFKNQPIYYPMEITANLMNNGGSTILTSQIHTQPYFHVYYATVLNVQVIGGTLTRDQIDVRADSSGKITFEIKSFVNASKYVQIRILCDCPGEFSIPSLEDLHAEIADTEVSVNKFSSACYVATPPVLLFELTPSIEFIVLISALIVFLYYLGDCFAFVRTKGKDKSASRSRGFTKILLCLGMVCLALTIGGAVRNYIQLENKGVIFQTPTVAVPWSGVPTILEPAGPVIQSFPVAPSAPSHVEPSSAPVHPLQGPGASPPPRKTDS